MENVDGGLIFSATDLINHLECPHLTELNIEVALGRAELEQSRSDTTILVARKGDEHERGHLARLIEEGREVVKIENGPSQSEPSQSEPGQGEPNEGGSVQNGPGLEGMRRGARETVDAMRAGAEVIYQGVLFDGVRWRGYSDFLHRVERPSELGDFSYEVADTKLARRVKPYFLLQLCFYSELVEAIQGVQPERMHVVLGTRETHDVPGRRVRGLLPQRQARLRVRRSTPARRTPTRSRPSTARLCRWQEHCAARREADDHLSLVAQDPALPARAAGRAGDRDGHAARGGAGGGSSAPDRDRRVRVPTRARASDAVPARERGAALRAAGAEEGCGFAHLPRPSEGDLFFDIEGDPFFDDGLEYLFGCVSLDINNKNKNPLGQLLQNGRSRFQAFWATDRASERQAFERFIDFVIERLERFPDLHIYHYAPYEATRSSG